MITFMNYLRLVWATNKSEHEDTSGQLYKITMFFPAANTFDQYWNRIKDIKYIILFKLQCMKVQLILFPNVPMCFSGTFGLS